MIKIKHRPFIFVLFLLAPVLLFSQTFKKKSGNGVRINFGPVVNFYTINRNHASNPTQKISGIIGFKREQRIGREYKTFLLFGADYFFHGLNFKSYYFTQDTLKIYDKSFAYSYSLFIHEINIPVQFKYLLKRADNSLFSPYVAATYHLRYLLPGILKVKQDGNFVKDDVPDVKFKNPLGYDKLNAALSLSLGWQKNSLSTSKGSFFVELNCRYNFSPYYFETDYAAASLFINNTHLAIQLGFKF